MNFQFTARSENSKLGAMPVTTSSAKTCPSTCPFKGNGCYAEQGPISWNWRRVTAGVRGDAWENLLQSVRTLPAGQLWRHNQAGDLPGVGNSIASRMLAGLVTANQGKRGYTYTHKPMDKAANRKAVREANKGGFTVNLSANTLEHADKLADLNIAPIVVVLPAGHKGNTLTPAGRKVVQCPATRDDYNVTCAECGLCAVAKRSCIVGFPAHGTMKKRVTAISES